MLKLAFLSILMLWLSPTHGKSIQPTPYVPPTLKPMMTTVHYRAEFVCERRPFCAVAEYFEADTFNEELVAYVPLHCTNSHVLIHDVVFKLYDGDGFLDWNYEPRVKIYHDCQRQGKILENTVDMWRINENDDSYYKAYAVEINDRGYYVPRYRLRYYNEHYGLPIDQNTNDWIKGNNVYNRTVLFEPLSVGTSRTGEGLYFIP